MSFTRDEIATIKASPLYRKWSRVAFSSVDMTNLKTDIDGVVNYSIENMAVLDYLTSLMDAVIKSRGEVWVPSGAIVSTNIAAGATTTVIAATEYGAFIGGYLLLNTSKVSIDDGTTTFFQQVAAADDTPITGMNSQIVKGPVRVTATTQGVRVGIQLYKLGGRADI